MASTITSLISWDAFERFPDDEMHRELIDGELVELPPAKSKHSLVSMRIAHADVSALIKERALAPSLDGYFHGAPELAIEVVSPWQ